MRYRMIFKDIYFTEPKRTRWQFVAYPLLGIIRHDAISGQPCYQLFIDWLLWGIGIIVAFDKK